MVDGKKSGAPEIVIVTRDFPPYCPVAGSYVRIASLANFLAKRFGRVHVVHIKRANRSEKYPLDNRVALHPVTHPLYYFDIPFCGLPTFIGRLICRMTKVVKKILIYLDRFMIDYDQYSVKALENKVKNILGDSERAVVITSSPPHSIHGVGISLKRSYSSRIRWVADFRDPWTSRPLYQKKSDIAIRHRELEVKYLVAADDLTVVTENQREMFRTDRSGPITVVENGYIDVEPVAPQSEIVDFVKAQHRQGRMVIGYFGTGGIGAGGASGKDLAFLGEMLSKDKELFSKVSLCIQGKLQVRADHPWGDRLLVLGAVIPQKARANMALMDVGIHLYTCVEDSPMVAGSKFYEYSASGIGIWCLIPIVGKTLSRFGEKVGGVKFTDPHDEDAVRKDLANMLKRWCENGKPLESADVEILKEYRRDIQYKKFAEIVEKHLNDWSD